MHGCVVVVVAVVAHVVVVAAHRPITTGVHIQYDLLDTVVVAEVETRRQALLLVLAEVGSLARQLLHHRLLHLWRRVDQGMRERCVVRCVVRANLLSVTLSFTSGDTCIYPLSRQLATQCVC